MIETRRYFPLVRVPFLVVMLAALAVPACGLFETVPRLWSVQSAVAHAGGTARGSVSVNLTNSRYLAIALDNWAARSARPDEKRDQALLLAKAAYAAYDLRSTLERVTVTFPTVHKAMLLVSIRRVAEGDVFRFRSSDLIETAGRDRTTPRPPESISLHFLPIGDVPSDLMAQMASRLRTRFPMPLTVLPALTLDAGAYDERRDQDIADDLIASIQEQYPTLLRGSDVRIIAITSDDMYIRTKGWAFAFSLRDATDRIAVVSYARMSPETFGNAPDTILLLSRLRKMVTKNIGIMCYGFPVSKNPRSVLYDSIGGTDELDLMTEDFSPAD